MFANGVSNPFLFDDIASIPQNQTIRSLWPLRGHHPKVHGRQDNQGQAVSVQKGERHPITEAVLRRVWNAARKLAALPTEGPDRFRIP